MAYSTSTPPMLLIGGIANKAPNIWAYRSADAEATVCGASYFSNGSALGMKVGDFVLIYDTATPKAHIAVVITVTAGGAASLNSAANDLDLTMA